MNDGQPLISVVVPVHDRSAELQRMLEALSRQTEKRFEVLICDDGSTEDIRAVADKYGACLEIRLQRIPNSGGPAKPRNVAAAMARGAWIAFLDSDDWWDENRLAVIVPHLDDSVDLLYHPLRVVAAAGVTRRVGGRRVIGHPITGDALCYMALNGNPIPNSSVVLRRTLLERLGGITEDPDLLGVAEDFDTWLRAAELGARIRYLPHVLGNYWVGADGLSKLSWRHVKGLMRLYALHQARIPQACRLAALSCHHYTIGCALLQLGPGHHAQARQHLASAGSLPTWGLRMRRWLKLLQSWKGRSQGTVKPK